MFKQTSFYIGSGYWERVLNKRRSLDQVRIHGKPRKDITVNFGIDEIRREIEEEDARMEALENYDSDESSNYEFMSP